jgi:uncharacterized protein (DUF2235 family)
MGNEEMIAFAWNTFSNYQRHQDTKKAKADTDFMDQFKTSFCRTSNGMGGTVKVHFLGLFDCVNSVLKFSTKVPKPQPVDLEKLPAKHIRHALSIHDRRGMFQPVLFDPEPTEPLPPTETSESGPQNLLTLVCRKPW